MNLKELEVLFRVVNSSFKEFKGNLKELRNCKSHVMW